MPRVTQTAVRDALTHARVAGIALLATAAAACSGAGDAPRTASPRGEAFADSLGFDTCLDLAELTFQMGPTIGSPWYDVSLLDVFHGHAGRAPVACARDIYNRLRPLCSPVSVCRVGSSDCEHDAADIIAHVQQVFLEPIRVEGCVSCGDGVCSDSEDDRCPADCSCGDGICNAALGENVYPCFADCPSACGDTFCTGGEVCGACDAAQPEDGSGTGLACVSCSQDCCRGACGDGVCILDEGETEASCEADCSTTYCGDGVCFGMENARNCSADCASLVNDCGDYCTTRDCYEDNASRRRVCVGVAHCLNCPEACNGGISVCGDNVCAPCEVWTCAADCPDSGFGLCARDSVTGELVCPDSWCGDGRCDTEAESAVTCPLDCPRSGE